MIETGQSAKSKNRLMPQKNAGRHDVPADYAELQLKASILDLGADSVILTNDTGEIVYANEIAYKSHGYTKEEFLSMNMKQLIIGVSEAELVEFEKQLDKHQKDGPVTIESVDICKDGTHLPVESRSRVIEYNGNKYNLNIVRDISERKKMLKALEDSENNFRMLAENAQDVIMSLQILPTVKFVYVSPSSVNMTGFTPEEFYADPSIVQRSVHPDDREILNNIKQYLNKPVTLRFAHKDGRIVWTDQLCTPVYNKKNVLTGILIVCRDITERKQAEATLADEATRRRILFEKSNDGIVILDNKGKVFEANQRFADMIGYSLEEVRQLHIWDWDVGVPKEEHQRLLKHVDFTEKYIETTQRRKDGSVYYAEINSNKAEVAGQKLIFSMCRDITERKQAETKQKALLEKLQTVNTKLEQSNQALQDFAYIASHDLREPLRKISSFGSLLMDSLSEKIDDDEKENLDFMIDGANRMQAMIDDLLTYSRLTTMAKPSKPVDLNSVITDLKTIELSTKLDETGGTIVITQTLPTVLAEESQMHQLFQNLIGNGLKYHKQDVAPVITISSVNTDNNMVQIDIQDNGIGIPEEYHEKIFVMFKRLHSRSSFEGNGIGLAVCKKIVNRHGGEIKVISNNSEGSTFRFTLPRANMDDNNNLEE